MNVTHLVARTELDALLSAHARAFEQLYRAHVEAGEALERCRRDLWLSETVDIDPKTLVAPRVERIITPRVERQRTPMLSPEWLARSLDSSLGRDAWPDSA